MLYSVLFDPSTLKLRHCIHHLNLAIAYGNVSWSLANTTHRSLIRISHGTTAIIRTEVDKARADTPIEMHLDFTAPLPRYQRLVVHRKV